MGVHDPFTKHMLSKNMTCEAVVLHGCNVVGTVTFSWNQVWHSPFRVCDQFHWIHVYTSEECVFYELCTCTKLSKDMTQCLSNSASLILLFLLKIILVSINSIPRRCLDTMVSSIKIMPARPVGTQNEWQFR